MASSLKGESSYSYLTDQDVGLSLVDRFTYSTLDFFERVDIHSQATLQQLFDTYRWAAPLSPGQNGQGGGRRGRGRLMGAAAAVGRWRVVCTGRQ
jgi:hypothetical protein